MNNEELKPTLEIALLQDIHDILSLLEAGRGIDSLNHKIITLKEKIKVCKQEVESAEGIDNTQEEQEAILKSLQVQIQIKRELVERYRDFQVLQ